MSRIVYILMALGLISAACQPQVVEVEKEVVVTRVATQRPTELPTSTRLPSNTPLPSYTEIAPTKVTPTPTSRATSPPEKPSEAQPPEQSATTSGTVYMPDIASIPANTPSYSRAQWSHWSDDDGDCQDTRHEVLIAESFSTISFKGTKTCQVDTGQWYDPYTGITVFVAGDLDVDHMVPLQNAHVSGGWQWSAGVKKAFANDLSDADHLIAVTASANRSKGSRSPDEWKPPNQSYWCEYAKDWTRIKYNWGLTVTTAEYSALQSMLSLCATSVNVQHGAGSGSAVQTTIDESPGPVNGASCDCSGNTLNCTDFSTHAGAQACFQACGGVNNDVHGLDRDKDGSACESLPQMLSCRSGREYSVVMGRIHEGQPLCHPGLMTRRKAGPYFLNLTSPTPFRPRNSSGLEGRLSTISWSVES